MNHSDRPRLLLLVTNPYIFLNTLSSELSLISRWADVDLITSNFFLTPRNSRAVQNLKSRGDVRDIAVVDLFRDGTLLRRSAGATIRSLTKPRRWVNTRPYCMIVFQTWWEPWERDLIEGAPDSALRVCTLTTNHWWAESESAIDEFQAGMPAREALKQVRWGSPASRTPRSITPQRVRDSLWYRWARIANWGLARHGVPKEMPVGWPDARIDALLCQQLFAQEFYQDLLPDTRVLRATPSPLRRPAATEPPANRASTSRRESLLLLAPLIPPNDLQVVLDALRRDLPSALELEHLQSVHLRPHPRTRAKETHSLAESIRDELHVPVTVLHSDAVSVKDLSWHYSAVLGGASSSILEAKAGNPTIRVYCSERLASTYTSNPRYLLGEIGSHRIGVIWITSDGQIRDESGVATAEDIMTISEALAGLIHIGVSGDRTGEPRQPS